MLVLVQLLAVLQAVGPQDHARQALDLAGLLAQTQQTLEDGVEVCDVAVLSTATQPRLFVATVDMSGRRFCNEALVLRVGSPPKIIASLSGWWLTAAGIVRDVDGDGVAEVVVPHSFSPYEGAMACVATFPAVYRCSVRGCSNISRQVPQFYRAEIQRATALIRETRDGAPRTDPRGIPCFQMAIAKIKRHLGEGAAEELKLARRWMTDPDKYLRAKAVSLFEDIGTPEAIGALRVLATDPEPDVSLGARPYLERRTHHSAP